MTVQNRYHTCCFMTPAKQGCLWRYKGKLVRIQKVKLLKEDAVVVVADANHSWRVKVVKVSRIEPLEIYFPMFS